MYTLIMYIILQGRVQAIQIDGFASKEKCEQSFYLMDPVFKVNNISVIPFCITKE